MGGYYKRKPGVYRKLLRDPIQIASPLDDGSLYGDITYIGRTSTNIIKVSRDELSALIKQLQLIRRFHYRRGSLITLPQDGSVLPDIPIGKI